MGVFGWEGTRVGRACTRAFCCVLVLRGAPACPARRVRGLVQRRRIARGGAGEPADGAAGHQPCSRVTSSLSELTHREATD